MEPLDARKYLWVAVAGISVAVAACRPGLDEQQGAGPQSVIRIEANSEGFVPDDIYIPAGEPTVLEFVRTTDQTCATEVLFAESGIRHELPLNTPIRVSVAPPEDRTFAFACEMDMHKGSFGTTGGGTPRPLTGNDPLVSDGVVDIQVDQTGFHPDRVAIPAGEETILQFTRTAESTCNTGVLIPTWEIQADLPLNEPVEVVLAPAVAGEVSFTCPMEMSGGIIEVVDGK